MFVCSCVSVISVCRCASAIVCSSFSVIVVYLLVFVIVVCVLCVLCIYFSWFDEPGSLMTETTYHLKLKTVFLLFMLLI